MLEDCAAIDTFSERPQGIPVDGASGSLAPTDKNKNLAISAGDAMQVLFCLTDLLRANAEDPGKVHAYAKLVDERLQSLGELMRPMLWNRR